MLFYILKTVFCIGNNISMNSSMPPSLQLSILPYLKITFKHRFKMLLSFPKFTFDTQATSHLPMYAKHSYLKI